VDALLWPSGAPAVTVLAFIMLGDAVRDALDPKLR
jgi:oligopeptide transport system permease protein